MFEQPIVHKEPAVQSNPFAKHLPDHVSAGAVAIESERAIAEAQGKLVIAKRFPRDQARAYAAIIDACKRPGLAEEACYSFPRGGQTVSGPSIRLAEMLAANWGNIDYGIRELSRKEGVSEMEAYCWDLETNTMSSQKFTVRHIRDTRGGGVKLTDERDIYELTANMGGRRLRARILAILPADLIQAAVDECGKTLAGGNDLPIGDRVRSMISAFKVFGVQPALIEKRIGHTLDAITGEELADLRKIHNSIRDGISKVADWFGGTPRDDGEQIEGDPAPVRPAPKPASPKGAAKAKENAARGPEVAGEIVPEAAPVEPPEPVAPPAPVVPPPAAPAPAPKAVEPAPAPKPRGKAPAIVQRSSLQDKETIEVVASVTEFKVMEITKEGVVNQSVSGAVSGPEFKGPVFHLRGASLVDGKREANPAWQLDKTVALKLRGEFSPKQNRVITWVESIAVHEAKPVSPVSAEDV